jgi:phytoene synthase
VAGTVGLMMCGVLGVRDPKALPFAIDLGVAMQLTNISRDVAQDADMGRVYIPATRLRALGIESSPSGLQAAPQRTGRAVHDLLAMADRYYRSAHAGIAYIPWRACLAIRVASSVYRAIGVRLIRLGCDPMSGRTVVPFTEKLWWAATAVWQNLRRSNAVPRHRGGLHRSLQGLPGVDAGAGEG